MPAMADNREFEVNTQRLSLFSNYRSVTQNDASLECLVVLTTVEDVWADNPKFEVKPLLR